MQNAIINIHISCEAHDLGHVLARIRKSFKEADSGVSAVQGLSVAEAQKAVEDYASHKADDAARHAAQAERDAAFTDAAGTDTATQGPAEGPKRKRRTKAEIQEAALADALTPAPAATEEPDEFVDAENPLDFVEPDPVTDKVAYKPIDDTQLRAYLMIQNARIGDATMPYVQKFMVEVRERIAKAGDKAGAEAVKTLRDLSQADRQCLIERFAAMAPQELKTAAAEASVQQHADFLASIAA